MKKLDINKESQLLLGEFKVCQKAFIALGDETRQQIIIALLESGCKGLCAGEIPEKTKLSRPAVSHHLQILKDAEIVAVRNEGTRKYYYMSASMTQWSKIAAILNHVNDLVIEITKRKEE
ncbi:transcriptional repressor SdpR [Clostridium puniceum]|uniref:Transcriptional repressor SdpR n=1 Tax=Clostridium puniceum TaxID=29367 RepID=A0A1S8T861_9CLOT|nr:metalloregulator ArsR/SmtB family transcription factor [Clostridium puniceum]OOM73819.1 transcriptional repressor SdpR [Clostridium puniceum]